MAGVINPDKSQSLLDQPSINASGQDENEEDITLINANATANANVTPNATPNAKANANANELIHDENKKNQKLKSHQDNKNRIESIKKDKLVLTHDQKCMVNFFLYVLAIFAAFGSCFCIIWYFVEYGKIINRVSFVICWISWIFWFTLPAIIGLSSCCRYVPFVGSTWFANMRMYEYRIIAGQYGSACIYPQATHYGKLFGGIFAVAVFVAEVIDTSSKFRVICGLLTASSTFLIIFCRKFKHEIVLCKGIFSELEENDNQDGNVREHEENPTKMKSYAKPYFDLFNLIAISFQLTMMCYLFYDEIRHSHSFRNLDDSGSNTDNDNNENDDGIYYSVGVSLLIFMVAVDILSLIAYGYDQITDPKETASHIDEPVENVPVQNSYQIVASR